MNALAVGIANAVAAQSATSRLLFSMSRDGRLPRFLAHVNPRTRVPERAILLVGGLTCVLGLVFVGQIGTISSLVNFGALTALPAAAPVGDVLLRRRASASKNMFLHWIAPILGLPHHRLRALERRAGGQDRRPHLARHRHPGAHLLHLARHRHPARARRTCPTTPTDARPTPGGTRMTDHLLTKDQANAGLLRQARAGPADHAGHRRADHLRDRRPRPTPRWSSSATCPR